MSSAVLEKTSENTQEKRRGEWLKPYAFKPGNPGRPKGSRNKLGEAFIEDLHQAWQQRGSEVIDRVIADKPEQFLKVIASVIPQEINHRVEEYDQLDDDALAGEFRRIANAIQARVGDRERARATPAIEGSAREVPE